MKKIYLSKNSISDAELQKIVKDLEDRGYEVIVSSYNKENGEDIENVVKDCDLVLILIAGNCDGDVDFEIETSVLCGKGPVGIYVGDGGEEDIPESLKKMGSGVIPFDLDKIDKIIQGDDSGWYTPEGKNTTVNGDGERSEC